jgi:hypothetical protein
MRRRFTPNRERRFFGENDHAIMGHIDQVGLRRWLQAI